MHQLRILTGERQGEVFPVGEVPVTIGRTDQNTIVLPDAAVSRQHSQVYTQGGNFFVRNLRPDREIYVDGKAVSGIVPLRPGTFLQVGGTQLAFEAMPQAANTALPARSTSSLLPVSLGVVGGLLVLALVLGLTTLGPSLAPPELTATAAAIALASASPTASQTATALPTETAIPTFTPEPTATATPEPTATPVPLLAPQVGEIRTQPFTGQELDLTLLDQMDVTWPREVLHTVPITFTNNTGVVVQQSDINVGLYATINGDSIQVPSFRLSSEVTELQPDAIQTYEWQVVLPNDVPVEAWAVLFRGKTVQGFLTERP